MANEKMLSILLRYHLIAVRMVIIKKFTNHKCWQECEQKGTLVYYYCWNVNCCSRYGNQ